MQVDLCVFLTGHKLEEYVPLFIETLFRNCSTSNIHIHVVEKGTFLDFTCESGLDPDPNNFRPVGKHVHEYLLRKQTDSWDKVVPFTIHEMPDPSVFFRNSSPSPPDCFMADDHANTLNWAIANCGTRKWVIFCHLDMVFVGDIITEFINNMDRDIGLFGLYNHCFAVNREAFQKVGVKFNSIPGFRAVPVTHSGFDYVIRHSRDPRCTSDSKIIYGWDVGELLELIMVANGWRCNISQFEVNDLSSLVEHLGSGHEYTNNETMKRDHASKRQNMLGFYMINRIEES
jgi:hypothetical protein